ncbi:prominin-like protein isoform X2 [Zophobas morio]|uniref:prominin-like protein isoform X2 n=1 Tax=Zophobas morio TaxID=2755281 RepID=UPI0030834531
MASERQKVNIVSFLVAAGILCVAVELSSGSFATRINKISENLDRALSEVMDDKRPEFTNLTDNATYVSDTYFNPKGMAGLYNFTNAFIDVVFSKNLYPEGFVTVDSNNNLHLGNYQQEWKSLLVKYGGLLAMIIILGLIVVLMPLCGLCFCCCRCCGKCGARSQPFDKKHDLCKKIVLATILIALGTLLLFGVVCAFVSNQQMEEGVGDLTDNLRKGVKDVNTYLDTTKGQIDTLLNVNYGEFEKVLLETINDSSNIVYGELADYANAISMTEVANIVEALPDISIGFVTLKYSTNSLRVYASQLNDAVRKVKKDMLELLKGRACENVPKCQEISGNVSLLQTNIHFNNLPDITDKIAKVEDFVSDNRLSDAVNKGKEKLESIRLEIGEAVNDTLATARTKINEAGAEIQKRASNITNVVVDLKNQIDVNTRPNLNTAEKYIVQYSPYRYYVALAISCLLLLITVCIALGLICGICGKRPEGYGDDCCNKGAGSSFLICGVYFMFLTGFIVAVVVAVCFLLGVVAQRGVCDPLRDPTNSQLFKLIDQVDLSQFHIDFPISKALENCYQNKSIYVVFNLKSKFDLDEIKNYLNKFNINQTLVNLNLTSLESLGNFTILGENDMQLLESFANSGLGDINFDEFKDLLSTNFTTVNLTDLSNELGTLINEIEKVNNPDSQELIDGLQVNKLNIDMYQEKIVEPMILNATKVIHLAEKLDDQLKFGHSSFEVAMDSLVKELKQAEEKIQNDGYKFLNATIIRFTQGIVNQVQTYIDRVVDTTEYEVGQCGPLSLVINATLTSTCDKILLPWNGYWFGLFWSVLLFIPTIIISVKLATLYQKHSAYARDLVETEYLYDAYVDRDNIPLNRGGKSKKKNKKHKRYEDRPVVSAGGDMVAREYAAGSNHQDARYADMAPKQWEDFPAGGPPQYQRAPTEYERPPPYYYPGAGENTQ